MDLMQVDRPALQPAQALVNRLRDIGRSAHHRPPLRGDMNACSAVPRA